MRGYHKGCQRFVLESARISIKSNPPRSIKSPLSRFLSSNHHLKLPVALTLISCHITPVDDITDERSKSGGS